MATRNKINSHEQIKELNNKLWICQRIIMTETTTIADYDFPDESGRLWKKVRPASAQDLNNPDLAGQSQDDELSSDTNNYTNDDFVGDYLV